MEQDLELTPLAHAVDSLRAALAQYHLTPNDFIRDSCIQRFEYTYELSWKMLKRYMRMTEPSAETIDEMTFPALIRTASERGLLLSNWAGWKDFRDARNMTSHGYDSAKAEEVFSRIPDFFRDACFLLEKLRERIGAA